jgi:hypothetical protein
MAEQPKRQDGPRRLSSSTQAEQRDKLVRQEIEKERAASAAKTAKLRALRLAKEAADKEAADKRALEKAATKAKTESVRRKPAQDS